MEYIELILRNNFKERKNKGLIIIKIIKSLNNVSFILEEYK